MKITEALSNVITEAGGTPTAEDADSVTHALGTLYTTLGGTDTLVNDVAQRVSSLSTVIGGGGGSLAYRVFPINVVNATSGTMSMDVLEIVDKYGEVGVCYKTATVSANTTKEMPVSGVASEYKRNQYTSSVRWSCKVMVQKSIGDASKFVATTTAPGTLHMLRYSDGDNTGMYAYMMFFYGTGDTTPTITFSVTA